MIKCQGVGLKARGALIFVSNRWSSPTAGASRASAAHLPFHVAGLSAPQVRWRPLCAMQRLVAVSVQLLDVVIRYTWMPMYRGLLTFTYLASFTGIATKLATVTNPILFLAIGWCMPLQGDSCGNVRTINQSLARTQRIDVPQQVQLHTAANKHVSH